MKKLLTVFCAGMLLFSASTPTLAAFFGERENCAISIFGQEFGCQNSTFSTAIALPFPLAFLFVLWGQVNAFFPVQNDTTDLSETDLSRYIPNTPTQLTIWMLADSADVFRPDLNAFSRAHPQTQFSLIPFGNERLYADELRKAFARGEAPDLFFVNHELFTELLANSALAPAPEDIFSKTELATDFYPIAQQFAPGNAVYAAPLFGYFPVMFSNRALLTDDRIFVAEKPGKTWAEIFENFQKFREYGDAKILPFALGNPDFAPSTFSLFLLLLSQAGVQNFSEKAARDALSFLVGFWTGVSISGFPKTDVEAFSQGRTAVIFGDERVYQAIKDMISADLQPRKGALQFANLQNEILPQFTPNLPKTIGEEWGIAVSYQSEDREFAWALAATMSDEGNARAHFLKTGATALRKNIPNGVFSESAALAVSGGIWQRLDFSDVFVQNVRTLLSSANELSFDVVLQRFSQFFDSLPQ